MAKTKVSEFDATASNNTDINSVNVAEGCPPSGINNAIREMASLLKKQEVGTDAMTSPDIDGGTIDGATIGASSASTGAFTTISASGNVDFNGDLDVDGTTNLDVVDIDGAVDMASTLAVGGVVTANAGVVVDNITIDGQEIDVSSGNFLIDVAGDISLDAGGAQIIFLDDTVEFGQIYKSGNDLHLYSAVSDGDLKLQGNDGGSLITALTLDMSDAGTAIFNHDVNLPDNGKLQLGASQDLQIYHNSSSGNSFIADEGTGGIILSSGSFTFQNQSRDETHAVMTVNGSVDLYHNNVKKFETTSVGIDVTGDRSNLTAAATSTPASGNGMLNLKAATARVNGNGPFIGFFVPNSTGSTTVEDMGVIGFVAPDSTNASRKADFIIRTRNTSTGERFRCAADGTLTATDTSIGSQSDSRLKKDITDYTYDLAKFKSYDVKKFNWKHPELHMDKTNQIGFLAQDLQNVDTQWVSEVPLIPTDEDGNAHIEAQYLDEDLLALTSKLGEKDAMYISVIQQLIARIETLENA